MNAHGSKEDWGPGLNNFLNNFELLALTFLHCLPEHDIIIDPKKIPLKLTYVCRWWKYVAESTSLLWNRFHLELRDIKDRKDVMPYKQMLEKWLRNSRVRPLQVTIMKPDMSSRKVEQELALLLLPLRKHEQRWLEISLKLPAYALEGDGYITIRSPTLRKLHLDFSEDKLRKHRYDRNRFLLRYCPRLEELILRGRRTEEADDVTERQAEDLPIIYCLDCPQSLKVLEMHSVYFAEAEAAGPFGEDYLSMTVGEQISMLFTPKKIDTSRSFFQPTNAWKLVCVDTEIDVQYLIGIHKIFPTLTWLEIKHPYRLLTLEYPYLYDEEDDTGAKDIILPKLRHLSLMVICWEVLLALKTPELTSLELDEGYPKGYPEHEKHDVEGYDWFLEHRDLVEFITNNSIVLTTFKLTAVTITETMLINVLNHMHGLDELDLNIKDRQLTDYFLRTLSHRLKDSVLESSGLIFLDTCKICPFLSTLRIQVDYENSTTPHEFSDDAVIALAKSREVLSESDRGKETAWKSLSLPLAQEALDAVLEVIDVNLTSSLEDG